MMNLSEFDNSDFDRGASRLREFLWIVARSAVFACPFTFYALKRSLLRSFGATIGPGVIIKPAVTLTFPWKLSVGRSTWIGDQVFILNLAPVTIGSDVCISQRAFLCTGNHNWSDPRFALTHSPITIGNRAWICADVFVGPGVTIGDGSVVTAGSVVTSDLPNEMICSGNPCVPIKKRALAEARKLEDTRHLEAKGAGT